MDMMREKILIVDDEKEIADLVECYLDNENYSILKFYDSEKAYDSIVKDPPDLAIMDVMMPGLDGYELCRRIRKYYNFPVIMLTAKGEEIDKITGLTLGADDYIAKPFLPLEMAARVKAQIRRYKRYNSTPSPQEDQVIMVSGLVLNAKTHECTLNEHPLSLTPTEFKILWILCENNGAVVSAESLFRQIWENEYFSKNNNTITVHIRHLREKMHDSFENPRYIKTVWGCGYKIES